MRHGRIHGLKSLKQDIAEEQMIFECYPEYKKYRIRQIDQDEINKDEINKKRKMEDELALLAIKSLDPDFM